MSYSALGFLRHQYLCVLRRCAWFNAGMVSAGLFAFPGMLAYAAPIVPDGRTLTQLTVNGSVTDITTGTIRGANAYNSFSRFNVETAKTVNLHLPGQTNNLLNLVHDQTSYINGLVNAYKDGRIGGNVFFFNPHGIVVGSEGVLNVGSLTLATPTPGFMNELVDPSGAIGDAASAAALAGHIPLSQTGLVLVKGRVHAADAVNLAGGNVRIAQGAEVLAGGSAQVAFADLVNVDDLRPAAEVKMDGGVIRIVAAEDITVAGRVSADGAGAQADGGTVTVMADRDATLKSGAVVSANAGDTGDGGFVEFSAKDTVTLAGGSLQASAAMGEDGSILIDPKNLSISADLLRGGANPGLSGVTWNAGSLTLQADNKLTIDNAVVSTRNVAGSSRADHISGASVGDSGDLALQAKDIEIRNGSKLLTFADQGFASGGITIEATDNQSTPVFGSFEDSIAKISIKNAEIKGGDVSIKATANDKWVWTGNEYADTVLDFLDSLSIGLNITKSVAHATIEVDDGAQIDAKGKLDIESHATADASMKVLSTLVGVGYGETDSQAKVTIGNATLGADGAMNLKSQADSTLSVTVDTVNTGSFNNLASSASKYANFAFAVAKGNQVAETTVGSAATITRASSLDVEATGEKDHSVASSGGSFKDGVASAGVSVLITDTTMTASLGGNVTAGKVAVKAALADDASTEASAAAGTAGSPDLQESITSARPVDEILFEKLSDFVAKAPDTDSRSGNSSKLGLSAAFAWVESDNTVKAEVAKNAQVTTPGSLEVLANATESLSFQTSAAVDERDLDKPQSGSTQTPEDKKKVAISASVLVADVTHHADALIGDSAVISAGGPINVRADAVLSPFWQQWVDLVDQFKTMQWKDADAWAELGSAVYDVLGDPINATTWTQTAVESEKLGFAGAVDFFEVDQKATARIGNASINASSTTPTADQDVNVVATASQFTLNLVGVPEFDPTSAPGSNSTSGTAGFGGSYLQYTLTGGTDASIASGANVRADDVVVLADTDFDQINVAESVGKAAKVSINGAFSLVDTDVHTIAQIGAGGTMTAGDVLVKAADDSLVINVAGGVGRSQSVGVGLSVAINELDRDTRAIVGNRAGETASGGTMTLGGNLLVDAHTGSTQGAFTVAGSGPSGQEKDDAKGGDGKKTNAKDSGKQGKSGVGISGAASVNIINDTTAAAIADLNTITVSSNAASSVAVDKDGDGTAETAISLARGLTESAKNDALVLAGAGSLTVAQDKSAGLAGAFTWNELVKDTRATLADASVTVNGGGVNLDADNTGAMWSISAGGAVVGKVGVAGSVSYSTIDNVTEAAIDDAGVDADSTVILDAKDDSDIKSVAGSVSYGGKAGIGAAVAINSVDSDTTARISGAGKTVSGDAGVSATATNDNSILAVAVAIGASQGVAASGAVTWNVITNQTEASMSGATVSSTGNAVNLDADDKAEILAISGNAAISTGQGSVGISGSYNEIDNETYARATGGSLSGTSVRLEATEDADIQAIAAGGAGASKVAVSGSLGVNTIGNITEASTDGTTVNTAGDATVRAADDSEILSITGAIGAAGNGAVGASGSYNHIGSTVTAAVAGGSVDAANILVDAERSARMEVWAVAGSGAGTAGFAGSIALNDIGGVTTASVSDGADVEATGNALVTAQSDDEIAARAGAIGVGGSVGGAGSIAFNDVHADTLAQVTGSNTQVTGLGNGGVAQVDNGSLSALSGLPSSNPLKDRQQKDNMRGAAVVASSTSQVENFAISASGGGSTGVAGTVSTALMTGYTSAEVMDNAKLNASFGGGQQEARVAAYHHDNLASGSGGGAIGGDVGAGGAMDTLIGSHITTAQVNNASVQAQKAVRVDAGATTEIAQAVIGLGGGTYAGLSGSIGLVLLDSKTQALVFDGDLNSKGDLTVEATSDTAAAIAAGAVSLSGVAGIGLTGTVSIYDQTTQAIVADGSNLNANKTTRIKADNHVQQDVIAGTASAAGGVGIAGTVNVAVIKGTTQSVFGAKSDSTKAASHINADAAYGGSQQDVVIEAGDTTHIDNYLGGLGVGLGGAGVGAAVDVVMVNNGASAEVRSGSVTADRDITVQADTERMVDSFTIAAAGGSTAGISGAVSVLTVGSRPDADAKSESDESIGQVARYVSANAFGSQLNSDAGGTSASRDRANAARAKANVANDVNAPAADHSARAYVASGTTMTAGRDASVSARNATDTDAIAVGVAVSGGLSLGGGVALAFVDDKTLAEADGVIKANRNVTVAAEDGALTDTQGLQLDVGDIHINQRTVASRLLTFAGGGGVVGLGASVAILDKSSSATAKVGDYGEITAYGTAPADASGNTGLITVDAGVNQNLESKALGAAVGLGGIGVALAYVEQDGSADAQVGSHVKLTGKALDVHGHGVTTGTAEATAAAGGIVSGAGADTLAKDTSSASASLGSDVILRTQGGTARVWADSDPVASADSNGIAVSAGVSVGVSLAEANVDTDTTVSVGDRLDAQAGSLELKAETKKRNGKDTAYADALAAAGGLLAGASATSAQATVRPTTTVNMGTGNLVTLGGAFSAEALSNVSADSRVSGINVGFYAAGGNKAKSVVVSDTETVIAGGSFNATSFKANADSTDELDAASTSGAGGLGVVLAARVDTDADATTKTQVGGTITSKTVDMDAKHTVDFQGTADSTSASVAGFSGAGVHNDARSTTTAKLSDGARVLGAESFTLDALTVVSKGSANAGWTVQAASGGVLSGASGGSYSSIHNDTRAEIGTNAYVETAKAGFDMGTLSVSAKNDVDAYDAVLLDTGGAIAIAHTESSIDASDIDANVKVGSGSLLTSDGDIVLESRTDAIADTEAQSKTYGLAGAPSGESTSAIATNNRVWVNGARLESDENIRLLAGQNNNLRADAETRLWNKTAFPINSDPEAHGIISQNNTMQVDAYTGANLTGLTDIREQQIARAALASVKDIDLLAGEGSHVTRGYGRGTDLYREAAEAVAKVFDSDASLDIVGGDTHDSSRSGVTVNGTVFAGTHYRQYLEFDTNGNVARQSDGMSFSTRDSVSLGREIDARIAYLTARYNEYKDDNSDVANGFLNDIQILQARKAKMGVGASADFIDVDPVAAYTGNITISGDWLLGSASAELLAPGDSVIEVVNHSNKFLHVNSGVAALDCPAALCIPGEAGGLITLNGVRVSSNAEINARNQFNQQANFGNGNILDRTNSPDPVILLKNTYEDPVNLDALNPEIHVDGDISNVRGLAKIESTGSVLVASDVVAQTVDIATKGDFIKTFSVGFTHMGGDPTYADAIAGYINAQGNFVNGLQQTYENLAKSQYPVATDPWGNSTYQTRTYTVNGVTLNADGSTIAGNNVFISGEKLNINGLIRSGLPDFTVNINASVLTTAKNNPGTWIALDMSVNGESVKEVFRPKVRWDAANNRLELGSIQVQGGYMQFYGDIFSTGNGRLEVMDGYGRIQVNNTSGANLAVNRLDTGVGVQGTIKIVDTSTKNASGSPLETLITRENGKVVYSYSFLSGDSARPGVVVNNSDASGRSASYNTRANRRLFWINADKFDASYYETYDRACFLDCDVIGAVTDWLAADPGGRTGSDHSDTRYERISGEWLGVDNRTADYILDFTKTRTNPSNNGYHKTGSYYSGLNEHVTSRIDYWWTERNYYLHSLAASKPIGISFIGYDIGGLGVSNGNADLLLQSAVRNLTGNTSLSAGSIDSTSLGQILAGNLSLTATTGSIGAPTQDAAATRHLKIDLQPGGGMAVNAPNGGIALWEIKGDMPVNGFMANANQVVDLRADANLVDTNGVGLDVQAGIIRLTSDNGAIGSLANPLEVNVSSATGHLQAQAAKDIGLTETQGDMRILEVASSAGDVSLASPNGGMVDVNDTEQVDLETKQELLDVAKRVRLTADSGAADSADETVAAYNAQKQQAYLRYWQMRNLKAVTDADGKVTGYAADAYDPDFHYTVSADEAALLKTANGWSDADIQAYQAQQEGIYRQAATEFGTGGADTFDKGFKYDVAAMNSTLYQDLIQGAAWSEAEITNRVAAGLFKDTADTELFIEAPNVVGHDIQLSARDGIGVDKPTLVIGTDPAAWTEAQQLALLSAERADVTVDTINKQITIRQKDDVDFTLLDDGELTASAGGNVYLGSEEAVRVKSVSTPMDVRIKTGGELISTANAGTPAVIARNVTLEAAGGDLGEAGKDVLVQLASQAALTARADHNVYLANTLGNLYVDQIYARQLARVTTPGALLELQPDLVTDIQAKFISLQAGTTIGQGGNDLSALDLGSDPDGWLDLSAPGGIYIYSPTRVLNLRNVSTDGDFHLKSLANSVSLIGILATGQSIDLDVADDFSLADGAGMVSRGGDVTLHARSLIMGQGAVLESTQGNLEVTTDGDMELTGLTAGQDLELKAGGHVNATGTIKSGGDANLEAGGDLVMAGGLQAGGDLGLAAGGGMEIAGGGGLSSGGMADLYAQGDVDFTGGKLKAQGPVKIVAGGGGAGSLSIGKAAGSGPSIETDGTLELAAEDDVSFMGDVSAGAGASVTAGQDIQFAGGTLGSMGPVSLLAGTGGQGSIHGQGGAGPDLEVGGDLDMQAPDDIGGVEARVGGASRLLAKRIQAGLESTAPDGAMKLDVAGVNGGLAEEVDLRLKADNSVTFQTLLADQARVDADTPNLQVVNGQVGDNVIFETPHFSVRIDHQDRTPKSGLDARGFTLDGGYDLNLTPNIAYVGAFVINQNPRRAIFGNAGGFTDRESGDALLTQKGTSFQPSAFSGIGDDAPRSGSLVSVDPTLMDEERWWEEQEGKAEDAKPAP